MRLYTEEELNLSEDENQQESRKTKKQPWLILLFLVIILLFLLSCYMLGSHLYEMATREQYVINMVADQSTEITIFKTEYRNDTGEIKVSSINNTEDVVAPGTENEYILRLKNDDRVDIRYVLTAEQDFYTQAEVPIEIKLSDEHGNFILGSETEWVPVEALRRLVYKGFIEVGEFESLFFCWRWQFAGDDAYDTYLGNLEEKEIAGLNLAFWLDCTGDATQTMSENILLEHRHNWGCCHCCYLVWLLLLVAGVMFGYIWFIHKKLRKYEEELEECLEIKKMTARGETYESRIEKTK